MRTTIDLHASLVRAARVRAAQRGETLKVLFMRALNNELKHGAPKARHALPLVGSRRPGASTVTPEELEQNLVDDDAGHVT